MPPGSEPKPAFIIGCSREIFSDEEIEIPERFGRELERLAKGEQLPETEAQQRFVDAARGRRQPESIYEKTWAKYLWRMEWESQPENRSAMAERHRVPDDREDWKRMRGAAWGEVRRRAKGWTNSVERAAVRPETGSPVKYGEPDRRPLASVRGRCVELGPAGRRAPGAGGALLRNDRWTESL